MNVIREEKKELNNTTLKLIIRSILWGIIAFSCIGALLFVSAGTMNWVNGWIFIITFFFCICINFIILIKYNPEVIEERSHLPKETKKWDLILMTAGSVFIIAPFIVAGLDERYNWSTLYSRWWIFFGIIMLIGGDFFILWAMAVNRWFSKVVAVQTKRGHEVITRGPYQFMRHPGYVGWGLMWLGTPLILDSLWAFVPTTITIIIIVIRTVWEDDTLKKELPGYTEYASNVKYKLIPGVW
ncbi:MAG: methyltransferase family protein [Thermodesulfobacteriota bacterium]